jgi:hypothetical protein
MVQILLAEFQEVDDPRVKPVVVGRSTEARWLLTAAPGTRMLAA